MISHAVDTRWELDSITKRPQPPVQLVKEEGYLFYSPIIHSFLRHLLIQKYCVISKVPKRKKN